MHHWSQISLYQYCCDLVDIDWVIGNPSRLLVNGLIWYWMYWCCYCCCCVIFHRCNDIHRWFVVVVDIRLRVTTTSLSLLSDTTMNDGERGWGRGHMSMPSNHPIFFQELLFFLWRWFCPAVLLLILTHSYICTSAPSLARVGEGRHCAHCSWQPCQYTAPTIA